MSIYAKAIEHDAKRAKRRRLAVWMIVGVVLIVGLGGFGIWYQFFRDNAPPPVSLEAAVTSIESSPTTTTGSTPVAVDTVSSTDGAAASDETTLNGQWSVVSDTDAFVGYRIGEELASIGTTEAVGRTSEIEGNATIDGMTLTTATITADMTSLTSDEARRDRALQRQSLETDTYPSATFELTEPIALPDSLAAGAATSIAVNGSLTLHGVTKEVAIPLDVQLTNGTLVIVGSLDIRLADYEIAPPSAPAVVSVNDTATLELQVYFARS